MIRFTRVAAIALSAGLVLSGGGAASALDATPQSLRPGAAAKAYIKIVCPLNDALDRYASDVYDALATGQRGKAQRTAESTRRLTLKSRDAVARLARQVRGPASQALIALAPAMGKLAAELGLVAKAKSDLSFARASEKAMDALTEASLLSGNVRAALDLPSGYCPS